MALPQGFRPVNYVDQKVDQLNKIGHMGRTDWDFGDTISEFTKAGVTPEQHYLKWGKDEGFYKPPGTTPQQNNTISMPSSSNPNAQGWANQLSAGIPNYFEAYQGASELPGKIDEWSQNAINRQRATGEQVSGIFNQVANQRAGTGISGGTEQQNTTAQLLTNLSRIMGDNRTNIEMNANQMKANAIAGLPAQAMLPVNAMTSLYGANAADQQNWASMAANLLNMGY